MRDQLEGLLERVEIDVMSNSDNVAIRKVKREGGKEGGREGGRDGGRRYRVREGGRGREALIFIFCRQLQQGFSTTLHDSSLKHQQVNYRLQGWGG